MTPVRCTLLLALVFSASFLVAQCTTDHRKNKNSGVLIADFTITGSQTISATDLARITNDMTGSCYDEDSEEMEQRLRAAFQDRGYFKVEVKSVRFKPHDPLGVPKPVTLEGDVDEGPQYKLADVSFANNHAFPVSRLRQQFPLKKGALMERGKVASGLESLRKLYGTHGYLDYIAIPEIEFVSNATVNLTVTIEEGPQYHMGKLDIVADKEAAGRLRTEWKLAEGSVYNNRYIDEYLTAARDILPSKFSRADVERAQNCPEASVQIRLIVDPAKDAPHSEPKNIPCEDDKDKKEMK